MVTVDEETQAKEFLKRAEIRTMKKDLSKLREADSLKERDKIVKIKTLEEQRVEQQKKLEIKDAETAAADKAGLDDVLQRNEGQERIAEKDLKNYATEQERQQIFLLESERLGFEKQIDAIDKEKEPALKLEKNKLLLLKRGQQEVLSQILEQEKKLEGEQKVITEKEQTTTIASERKGLEQARWDLDKKIQEVEKKRWEAEKQIEDTDKKVSQIDGFSEQNIIEKNGLQDKVLGTDKSLREIYSAVMAREEDKRRGLAQDQVARKEVLAVARAQQNEKIQRQQWSPSAKKRTEDGGYLSKAPVSVREKILKSGEAEEEQRRKFLQDVGSSSREKFQRAQQQEMPAAPIIEVPIPKAGARSPSIPPVPLPRRK